MSKLLKIESLTKGVRNLLEKDEKYRDDDALLVAAYYYERRGKELHRITAVNFLQMLVDGILPFPDNITRARRKLQEHNPHLRGKIYKIRQELEKEVREGINEL